MTREVWFSRTKTLLVILVGGGIEPPLPWQLRYLKTLYTQLQMKNVFEFLRSQFYADVVPEVLPAEAEK